MHYSYIIMSCTPEHAQNAVVDVWLDKLARLQVVCGTWCFEHCKIVLH